MQDNGHGGFTAFVPSLPGCIGEGDTREEPLANIQEAVDLHIETVEDDQPFSPARFPLATQNVH